MDLIQAFKEKHSDRVIVDDKRQETIDSIRKGEKKLHVSQKELSDTNIDQLHQYLNDLRSRYKTERKDTKEKADKISQASADEAQQQDQTDSNEPVKQLPDDINQLLQKVADRYDIEPQQIYKKYLQHRDELDSYPLESFKKVLLHAGGEFEKGYILPFKLNYDDKLTCLTVYKLTDDNSRNDIISEIKNAEIMLPLVSDKNMMSERDKIIANSFEQASKEKLLEYLWQLFDSIKKRL